MKNKFVALLTIIIGICLITSCAVKPKNFEVYSFSGEDDFIAINNGIIVKTDDTEEFIGGDITFKGREISNIKYYTTEFYFYKDGVKTAILKNIVSIEGSPEGTGITYELGSGSSETLFNQNDWDLLKSSLNFSLSGTYMNGDKFEYHIPLELKEIYKSPA